MKSQFEIPFVGLKIGYHDFELDINDTFFESLPFSIIEKGNLKVWLDLEKKESMLVADFEVCGTVKGTCSRCNEQMEIEVEGEMTVYYKFGNENEEDENLIVIPFDSYEINVQQAIYELIVVSIPSRPIHEEGECEKEMVQLIKKYSTPEPKKDKDDEVDPRWAALKNLN